MSQSRETIAKTLWQRVRINPDNEWKDVPFNRKEEFYIHADFVIADRKRVVEPLVKVEMTQYMDREDFLLALRKAETETLKNAGVEL
jgi:hypothetical protein